MKLSYPNHNNTIHSHSSSFICLHSHARHHHNTIRSTRPSISLFPPSHFFHQYPMHYSIHRVFILRLILMLMLMMMMISSSCKRRTTFPSPLRSLSPMVKAPTHITPERVEYPRYRSYSQVTNILLVIPDNGVENASNVFLERSALMAWDSRQNGAEEEEEEKETDCPGWGKRKKIP